ncbi:MAG: S-methyl-5'-thioinosine phosphorylase [Pseudomonadota bacterium]
MSKPDTERWGVIGGTGLDQLEGLHVDARRTVDTPYGPTSAPLLFGTFGAAEVVFLARHGGDHSIAPHRINYRANIWALAQHVSRVVAVAAVGGIRSAFRPGSIAIADNLIDYTWGREHTFFDGEDVQHIDFTRPYASSVREALLKAAADAAVEVHTDGVYGATQGPRLESAAEIDRMERDGCDLVGMTGMPEAALAKELGLAYACCAVIVNEAAGRGPETITMEEIGRNLVTGMARVRAILAALR